MYTDEGISAVNTKRREGFKQMVADGLAGKFDLLVAKSVSRFVRTQWVVSLPSESSKKTVEKQGQVQQYYIEKRGYES